MTKAKVLQQIAKGIEACPLCKEDTIGKAVPGEGNPDASIVFVGEAPGKQEAASGRPFIGKSGQILRKAIRSLGLSEEEVFITSVGKYLPIRGTPSSSQIAHGRIHLIRQLEIIQPRVVVLLGKVAIEGVLQERLSITRVHGAFLQKDNIYYFFTYHPAAGLRFPPVREEFFADFSLLKTFLQEKNMLH